MKTKTKSTAKKQKYGKAHRSEPPRKLVENRDLNEDEQSKVTNTREEYSEDNERFRQIPLDDVDQEEEREKKRRVEDARGEEEN